MPQATLVAEDVYLQTHLGSLNINVQHLINEWAGGRDASLTFPGTPTADAPLGRLSGYDIVERIGSGGTGHVYRAWDPRLKRFVAIKVLRQEFSALSSARDRFLREAHTSARLQHAAIAAVYEVHCPEDFPPWIAQEFIEGESLQYQIRSGVSLSPDTSVELVSRILAALTAAHQQDIVHRDVKPSNVLVTSSGDIKLVDFGLARLTTFDSELTADGVIAGTPAYMSPEQALLPGQVDHRADIYSVGVVLYELLTGSRPFRGAVRHVLHDVVHREPVALRRLDDRIPRDLETICLKAMSKDPNHRYETADDFRADLKRFQHRQPVLARPTSPIERFLRWTQRNPMVSALSSVLTLSLLAGAAVWASYVLEVSSANTRLEATVHSLEIANHRLQTSQQQAEHHAQVARQQSNVAFDMVTSLIYEVQQELADQPGTKKLRCRLLEHALDGLQRVKGDGTDVSVTLGEIMAANRMGDALRWLPADTPQVSAPDSPTTSLDQTDAADALTWYTHAFNLACQIDPNRETDRELCYEALAVSAWNLGDARQRRGKSNEAQHAYVKGLETARQWRQAQPDSLEATYNIAVGLQRLAAVRARQGRVDDQKRLLRDSVFQLEQITGKTESYDINRLLVAVRYELWASQTANPRSSEIHDIYRLLRDSTKSDTKAASKHNDDEFRRLHATICLQAAKHHQDPTQSEGLSKEALDVIESCTETDSGLLASARSVLTRSLMQQQLHGDARQMLADWGPPAADWKPSEKSGYLLTRMVAEMAAEDFELAGQTSQAVESVFAQLLPSEVDDVLNDQRQQWMNLCERLALATGDQR